MRGTMVLFSHSNALLYFNYKVVSIIIGVLLTDYALSDSQTVRELAAGARLKNVIAVKI